MSHRKSEFAGDIMTVRAVEDSIRVTRKYTKGAFRKPVKHPVQGEDFPSRMLSEYYEVYPDLEIGWDMLATDAWAWVWGNTPHIDVVFKYDYRSNKGFVIVLDGMFAVKQLANSIPNFSDALARVIVNGRE